MLDSQQWNYFIEPSNGLHPPGAESRVQEAVASGRLELIGTLDVLQELVEAARRRPDKSSHMVGLFLDLTGSRLLRPLDQRHLIEASTGGTIAEDARYLNRSARREVQALARRHRDVADLSDDLHAAKSRFKDQEVEIQVRIAEHLVSAGAPPSATRMRAWIGEVNIDEWVADIAQAGNDRGVCDISVVGAAGIDRFPSAWMFTAYKLARLVATLGEGRKIKPSDLADAHHVACGAYIDVLVTDDAELRRTLDLIESPLPFRWESSDDFLARFR